MPRKINTRQLTVLAMLSALSYLLMVVGRIPVVAFLKYDPKDVVIIIGGFLFGPLSAFAMSAVVSFVEMLTVSETGWIGLVMNILATCAFACTAALFYRRRHTLRGAVLGMVTGGLLMTGVMLLWNYFLTPLYLGWPREAVAELLLPVFLPFNLLKSALNGAVTLLVYKPVVTALRKTHLVAGPDAGQGASPQKRRVGVWLLSFFVVVTCVLLILVWQERI